jgi:hypothetical protein
VDSRALRRDGSQTFDERAFCPSYDRNQAVNLTAAAGALRTSGVHVAQHRDLDFGGRWMSDNLSSVSRRLIEPPAERMA